jgi:hypothetical protein
MKLGVPVPLHSSYIKEFPKLDYFILKMEAEGSPLPPSNFGNAAHIGTVPTPKIGPLSPVNHCECYVNQFDDVQSTVV